MTRSIIAPAALTAILAFLSQVAVAAPGGGFAFGLTQVAESFVTGFEDLPLMPGLTPAPDESVVFHNPTGRIVQAAARGRVPAAQVRAFYAETLPQLGWKAGGPDRFVREGEALRIDFGHRKGGAAAGDEIVVRFVLSPDK